MGPDDTGNDGNVLDDDCTVTVIELGVASPMVKPLMVTVNAVVAALGVVRITAALLTNAHVTFMFRPRTLPATAAGLREGEKKFGGYVSVIKPLGGGTVKVNVTETLTFPAIRSESAMVKVNGDDKLSHDPVGVMKKKGQRHATGARNVKLLCTTATSEDGRTAGAPTFSVTTISTTDTALQLVATRPSRNRALHSVPTANGLPVTVTEV